MNKLTEKDLLSYEEYAPIYEKFLRSVIEEKKIRRISLNDRMSGLFETRLSVWFQIQEMIRAEQISRKDYLEEMLEVYNELIPDDQELSMTLFIEIPNQEELRAFNKTIVGIEQAVQLKFSGQQITSYEPTAENEDDHEEKYTQSVHYLRFPFSQAQLEAFLANESDVVLSISHPHFQSEMVLPAALTASLKKELSYK